MQRKTLLAAAVAAALVPVITVEAQVAGTNADEVIVFGTQTAEQSVTGSRLGFTPFETPATVDVIDGDAVRARVDLSVLDAATRSAGFTNESNPGNGNSSIAARGFSGQNSVTKLYDGVSYFTAAGTVTFPFDTWGVERIEVLKGPSSVLFGEGGIGGAINVIPRSPQREQSGAVRLAIGEDSTQFVGVDYTNGIGNSAAFRVDYSNSQSDNWVPNAKSEAEMLSVAFLWEATDRLTINARLDNGKQEPMTYFGVPNANGDFVRAFVGSNFDVSDADIHFDDDSIRVRADWEISDTVSLQADVFSLSSDRFWKNTEAYFYDEDTRLITRVDPLVLGHEMDHDGMRANLVFAPTGGRLRASVGVESNDVSFERPTNFFTPANPAGITFDEFDEVDPFAFVPGTLASLTTAPYLLDNTSDLSEWAVFGEAQFNATDDLAIVAALRHDDYDTSIVRLGRTGIQQQADSTTGRIGVVYDMSDETALYAQYGTGAQHPSDGVITSNLANSGADMIESEQLELGIKHQAVTGFSWSLAVFDITKNNESFPNLSTADPTDFVTVPEQTSQGIEVGFTYAPSSAFQLYGNASTLNVEDQAGGRPPSYVPEQTANLGFAWTIGDAVRVIADARYVGDRFGGITIPSFTVFDASARFDLSESLGLTLKVDNLTDELYASSNYYEETWIVGRPRQLSLVMDFKF